MMILSGNTSGRPFRLITIYEIGRVIQSGSCYRFLAFDELSIDLNHATAL